jgi:AraC family transcriptional regulator, regulatory protein of adaptative response / DNA-3-methyladenine glycosylase II
VIEDFERCYQAALSRDQRFDGWFFGAVLSTGIYCRPSCPAVTPKRKNIRFYPSAAAAQQAGFRACKRCRPDASPGSPEWDARGDVVARAMRLIADGVIDRGGVGALAGRLGYSVRQLQRMLLAELGAGPLAIARAQRAQTARVLIETSGLSMAEVAFAAGFSSVRQFNDTIRAVFASSPSELRRRAGAASRSAGVAIGAGALAGTASTATASASPRAAGAPAGAALPIGAAGTLCLRLPFRRPLNPDNLFGHLAATAIPGVEEVRERTYRRTLRLPGGPGIVALTPTLDHVAARLTLSDVRDLTAAIARCRWLLDLDADPVAVDERLAADPALRRLVAGAEGRRVPRCVDGAELAVRAVLGQQVSTAAARTHCARLVACHGEPLSDPGGSLTHLFPSPAALPADWGSMPHSEHAVPHSGQAPGSSVGQQLAMPASRRRTLRALADALCDGGLSLHPGCDRERALAQLAALPGFGPWTLGVIAMRALGDPDAFPAADLGVRRAAQALGLPGSPMALQARSQAWRPWRAYAVQYLWSATEHPINHWPPRAVGARGAATLKEAA